MIKKILASIFLFISTCLATLSFAQTIKYTPETKFGFRKNEFQIVGRTAQQNYTYRTDNNKHFLDIYTDELSPIAIVELDYIPSQAQAIKFITRANSIHVLYQYNQSQIAYVVAAEMGLDGKLLLSPMVLDSTKTGSGLFTRNNAIFDYAISDNQEHITIFHRYQHNKQEFLNLKLFNTTWKQIAQKDILLSSTQPIYPQQFALNNNGILFFSSYIFQNASDHLSDFADIYTIDFQQDQFTKHQVPLEGLWIDQMQINVDQKNNALDYAALYSISRKNQIEGVVTGKIYLDEDKTPTSKKNKFSEALLAKTSTKKAKKYFDNYTLKEVIVKNDGSILMIAENYYITTRTSVPNAGFYASYYATSPSRSIKEYNYGDIVIINFDTNGAILWENIIRKNQYSQEDYGMFSSYAFVNTGKYLVFVYNDFSINKNALTMASITNDGKMVYKQIKVSDQPYDWVPKYAQQTSSLSILVPCFKSNVLLYAGLFL